MGASATVLTGRNDSAYTWDTIGNRSSVTHNGNTTNYSVNALNQYTQRDVAGYFDVAGSAPGSIVTVTKSGGATDTAARHGAYFFDAYALTNTSAPVFATLNVADNTTPTPNTSSLTAFLAKTAEPFTYDDDGNITRDGRWVYVYDAENRLITMFTRGAPDDPNASDSTNVAVWNSGVARQKLQFSYDYLGRRASKVLSNRDSGNTAWVPALNLRFLYDGWNLLYEFDAAASLAKVRAHVWGLDISGTLQGAGGVGGLLYTYDYASANSYLPAYDALGNVHGMIKASDGSLAAAYEYDAFGNTLRETGAYAASNPFRFATKYADLETGLVQYNTRYYSPSLGRFLNRDSISEQGGLNLYAYCGNNGVNRWDLLGQIDPLRYVLESENYNWEAYFNRMGHDGFDDPGSALSDSSVQLRIAQMATAARVENAGGTYRGTDLKGNVIAEFTPSTKGSSDFGLTMSGSVAGGAYTISDRHDNILVSATIDTETGRWVNTTPGNGFFTGPVAANGPLGGAYSSRETLPRDARAGVNVLSVNEDGIVPGDGSGFSVTRRFSVGNPSDSGYIVQQIMRRTNGNDLVYWEAWPVQITPDGIFYPSGRKDYIEMQSFASKRANSMERVGGVAYFIPGYVLASGDHWEPGGFMGQSGDLLMTTRQPTGWPPSGNSITTTLTNRLRVDSGYDGPRTATQTFTNNAGTTTTNTVHLPGLD